jgi:type IV pilus biogenesis protein CpaD/CtpE
VASADNNVTLVYERIQARDCESRYIDNPVNPYNLNHPTFGCSLAVNMVQMVSDKRQFTNPAIMDYPDAFKAGQAMQAYGTPPNSTPTKSDPNFQALATQGSLSIDSGGSYSSSSATR